MPQESERFSRFVRRAFLLSCAFVAIGMVMMVAGSAAVPFGGAGGTYLFTGGVWAVLAALLPAFVWLASAAAFRVRCGRWYLGMEDSDDFF